MQAPTKYPTPRLPAAIVAIIAAGAFVFYLCEARTRFPDRDISTELWRQARYFTILTTLLVATGFTWIVLTARASPVWSTALAYWIAIVGVVYHGLLARDLQGLRWWSDQALHTIVPITVVIWWLTTGPKSGLQYWHAKLWLIWPALYMAYALLRGEIDGRHPYFFIDPPLIGWPKVILWCVGLGGVFWLFGVLIIAMTRRFSPARLHPANGGPCGLRPQ
ncbi:MAG: Pr6Pr family membrane protein [Marinibacterium sp.]|nr:Pr6Pr family membrane protein [Marinibacterium sp.]